MSPQVTIVITAKEKNIKKVRNIELFYIKNCYFLKIENDIS
jgi:hypothetical protein